MRQASRDIARQLDRTREHGTDRDERALSRTCGLPLFTTAHGDFTVLGAPGVSRALGCVGSVQRRYVVVRADSHAYAPEAMPRYEDEARALGYGTLA